MEKIKTFKWNNKELQVTQFNRVSVLNFLRMIGDKKEPHGTWINVTQRYYNDGGQKFPGLTGMYINLEGAQYILSYMSGKTATKFKNEALGDFIECLGGDKDIVFEKQKEDNNGLIMYFGEIHDEIRITKDNMISVFDFIKVVGGQKDQRKTWDRIKDDLMIQEVNYVQFGKTKKTPVITVHGLVRLIFSLPGKRAKQFRSTLPSIRISCEDKDIQEMIQKQLICEIKKII